MYSPGALFPRFDISPGVEELKQLYQEDRTPKGPYQQFSSYPTAFVVAADVELSVSNPFPPPPLPRPPHR